jgi:WD40 repeat protein
VTFAPNYQSLVTVGGDKLVKRWSVAELHLRKQPMLLNTYEGHTNPTGRPAFSPDGTRLVTFGGSGDEVVRLWETRTGKQLASLVLTPAQIGNVEFLPNGKTVVIAVHNQPLQLWDVSGIQAPAGPPGNK